MQELFKKYYESKLAKYLSRNETQDSYNVHLATQSAKFALDDLVSTMRRNAEIYSQDQLIELLGQYVEDAA